jgi:hypothetical protein
MPTWLTIWLGRWIGGERLRKATSYDYRYWFGSLFLFPIVALSLIWFYQRFFRASGVVVIWAVLAVHMLAYLIANLACGRFVPVKLSLLLAFVSWGVLFYLTFTRLTYR